MKFTFAITCSIFILLIQTATSQQPACSSGTEEGVCHCHYGETSTTQHHSHEDHHHSDHPGHEDETTEHQAERGLIVTCSDTQWTDFPTDIQFPATIARLRVVNATIRTLTSAMSRVLAGVDVKRLDLYENRIETVEPDAFRGLDSVTELDLDDNQLRTLPIGMFQHLPNLERLYLGMNFWECNCDFVGLWSTVESMNIQVWAFHCYPEMYHWEELEELFNATCAGWTHAPSISPPPDVVDPGSSEPGILPGGTGNPEEVDTSQPEATNGQPSVEDRNSNLWIFILCAVVAVAVVVIVLAYVWNRRSSGKYSIEAQQAKQIPESEKRPNSVELVSVKTGHGEDYPIAKSDANQCSQRSNLVTEPKHLPPVSGMSNCSSSSMRSKL